MEAATVTTAAMTTAAMTTATVTAATGLGGTRRYEDRRSGKEQQAAERECFAKHDCASSSDAGREQLHHNRGAETRSLTPVPLYPKAKAVPAKQTRVAAPRKAGMNSELRIGWVETPRGTKGTRHRPRACGWHSSYPAGRNLAGGGED
jgi:hypothetical protein